jgi:hypothetical protein
MTRRPKVPEYKVAGLPPESIGAVHCLDDADRIFKRIYGERVPATRMEIAPSGWAKVRWVADKVFFQRGNSI